MKSPDSPCLFTETDGIRVVWSLSGACDLKCKHCAADSNYEYVQEIPAEKYADVLSNMRDAGVDALYITGGEPFLYKGLLEFVGYAKQHDMVVGIGTNGRGLDERKAQRLVELDTDKVFVSLDHYDEHKHDFLRSKDTFKKAVNAVRCLKDYDIYTRIDAIIWKENWKNLDEFVYFCAKLGADEVILAWPMRVGRAAKNPEILPPEEKYMEVGQILEELKEKYLGMIKVSYHRFRPFDHNAKSCNGGSKIVYIDEKGRVSPCFWVSALMPQYFTKNSIFEKQFDELISEDILLEFRELEKKRYLNYGPGCPAVCIIKNGKLLSKDPLLKEE